MQAIHSRMVKLRIGISGLCGLNALLSIHTTPYVSHILFYSLGNLQFFKVYPKIIINIDLYFILKRVSGNLKISVVQMIYK